MFLSKKIIILAILLSPLIINLLFEIVFFNSAYPNIALGNTNISGKNRAEIEKLVQDTAALRQNQTLSFSINNASYISVKLNTDLVKYDAKASAQKVLDYGRKGNIVDQLKQKLNLLTGIQTITPVYSLDELTLDTLLADAIRPSERPVVETTLLYTTTGLALSPSKSGLVANRQQVMEEIKQFIDFKQNKTTYTIQLSPKEPLVTRENSQQALEDAKLALSRPLTLKSSLIPDQKWTLDAPEMFEFLEFKYDPQLQRPTITIVDYKVASYSAQFAPKVRKDPVEAKFEKAGDKVIVFEPSQDGAELDSQKLTQEIAQHAFNPGIGSEIELPVKTIQPAISLNAVNQYGIKELIASGTSHFKNSSQARIHNLITAANKLNGVIIPSKTIFSMYGTIGDIEKSTGYQDSYIIKNGRTVIGIGGGVCQVSTTLFRAALNAGFSINERHPHSYRVSYYEQDSPPGFDAAVFFPTSDFKFTNNTDNNVLIQTKYNEEEQKLTINFFGVKDGRTVNITEAKVENIITPPPELRIFDETIPKGTTRQTEFAAKGSDVSFERTVTRDGKEIVKDSIKSHYYPWQAVYRIGTKDN